MRLLLSLLFASWFFAHVLSYEWKDQVTFAIMDMLKQFLTVDEESATQERIKILNDLITVRKYVIENDEREDVTEEELVELLPSAYTQRVERGNDGRRLQFNFPSPRGLDEECSNKLCSYMEKEFVSNLKNMVTTFCYLLCILLDLQIHWNGLRPNLRTLSSWNNLWMY